MNGLERRLTDIIRADPGLMHVLTTVRSLGLEDWRVFSGAVYQSVWNAVTGRPAGYGIRDYDLGYFDPDVSWDAEDAVIRRVAAAFEPPFREWSRCATRPACTCGSRAGSASPMRR